MDISSIATILCSVGGSVIVWYGTYRAFLAKTEQWQKTIEEQLQRIEVEAKMIRQRTHRHASRILTHELEIHQICNKLNISRNLRRDDTQERESE